MSDENLKLRGLMLRDLRDGFNVLVDKIGKNVEIPDNYDDFDKRKMRGLNNRVNEVLNKYLGILTSNAYSILNSRLGLDHIFIKDGHVCCVCDQDFGDQYVLTHYCKRVEDEDFTFNIYDSDLEKEEENVLFGDNYCIIWGKMVI